MAELLRPAANDQRNPQNWALAMAVYPKLSKKLPDFTSNVIF
jgi:hypothetical protein